jgi:molybdopterin converting factor small subunit
MARLMLPSTLANMLPQREHRDGHAPRSVSLSARSWQELVGELRGRFPSLAERVLTDSGSIAAGFVLVVNDEVQPDNGVPFDLDEDDEVCLLPALAGG